MGRISTIIICFVVYNVINFKITVAFFIESFFHMTKKVWTKTYLPSEKKEFFRWNKEHLSSLWFSLEEMKQLFWKMKVRLPNYWKCVKSCSCFKLIYFCQKKRVLLMSTTVKRQWCLFGHCINRKKACPDQKYIRLTHVFLIIGFIIIK